MTALLHTLPPGTRFTVAGRTATLLYANECRAVVRYDGDARHVELAGAEFDVPGRPVSIAARTEVEPITLAESSIRKLGNRWLTRITLTRIVQSVRAMLA